MAVDDTVSNLDILSEFLKSYIVIETTSGKEALNVPIIFITTKNDENSIEKAYDMGGADYITKPFLPKELLSRVKKELNI